MQEFDNEIYQRLLSPYPANSFLVPGSTPVLSFGDPESAKVVTIGINPSCAEFESTNGKLLPDAKRRLQDFDSLKIKHLAEITEEHASQIHLSCLNYFKVNPYSWFKHLDERINSHLGASYYDGTAAHLDLVQWATNPVWGRITEKSIRDSLLKSDAGFLKLQLLRTSADIVYMSGSQVFDQLLETGIVQAHVAASGSYKQLNGSTSTYLFYEGETFNGIPVKGWSRVLPGHYVPKHAMSEVFDALSSHIKPAA